MRPEIDVRRIHLDLAVEPLAEIWPASPLGVRPILMRLGRAVLQLRASFREAASVRRTQAQLAALDERLLHDIGLSRAEAAGWGPLGEHVRSRSNARPQRRDRA